MTTRHLVDPELLDTLDAFPSFVMSAETLPHVRAATQEGFAVLAGPAITEVNVRELHVPGPPGAPDVRVLVYTPNGAQGQLPGILHIHGGGYVIGQPEMSDSPNRLLAREVGAVVVSVDYRLAPENPFPAPIEDCYAALAWLHRNGAELGIDASRIAVSGESAGGGLAAALALLARDRDEVPLAFQLLIYPMLDDRTCTDANRYPHAGELVWTVESNRFAWEALLGCLPGGKEISPYAAAARATDLSGLPPTYISVGALDLFLKENMKYAVRLMRAGVTTELHVYPGAYHGFNIAAEAKVSKAFERDYLNALRRALRKIEAT